MADFRLENEKRRKTAHPRPYFPSDLLTFVQSPFASWMNQLVRDFPDQAPTLRPPSASLAQAQGLTHEQATLAAFEKQYGQVTKIPNHGSLASRVQATQDALRQGTEVIYQAALSGDGFAGYADFLIRVPVPSALGDYSYEPWETKLARTGKPQFILQLCCYAELLAPMQGVLPAHLGVILGTGQSERLSTEEYFDYYLMVKEAFLKAQQDFDPHVRPLPLMWEDPGPWSELAAQMLSEADHLSLVAGISEAQIRRLQAVQVTSMTQLGEWPPAQRVAGLSEDSLRRLCQQARLQCVTRATHRPVFELLEHPEGVRKGLRLLPPASPGDVYFDMEGYPLLEPGREYLFGASQRAAGELVFHDWWAHTDEAEKNAFEGFVDWVAAQLIQDPQMHVYHYGDYEVSALKRLAARHATREAPVDEFLRQGVFVNLHALVMQSLRTGEPKYSIKNLEKFYGFARAGDVKLAADSLVEYAKWLGQPDGADWRTSDILKSIRDYNEADCESTEALTLWLRKAADEAGIAFLPREAAADEGEEASAELVDPAVVLADELRARKGEDPLYEQLAYFIDFHRRESKPVFWDFYARLEKSAAEWESDPDCLTGLRATGVSEPGSGQSQVHEFTFYSGQPLRLKKGKQVVFAHDPTFKATIERLDYRGHHVWLKMGPQSLAKLSDLPTTSHLISLDVVNSKSLGNAIFETLLQARDGGLQALPSALQDFLYRRLPRVRGHQSGTPLLAPGEDRVSGTARVVGDLESSLLCIQGPPGTGKTYLSAKVILSLLARGARVGIAANSHEAVHNLLERVAQLNTGPDHVTFAGLAVGDISEAFLTRTGFGKAPSGKKAFSKKVPADLIGGTPWAFVAPEALGQLDYLFVEEAGQVCSANLIAMARSTRNIILVGDQNQLEQPIRAVHPGESGLSCLQYLLQGQATIAPERGIFLNETRRIHPDICGFISRSFYQGQLRSHPLAGRRHLEAGELIERGTGIFFVPVDHRDNTQASDEEAEMTQQLTERLLQGSFVDENSESRPLAPEDILFVAPYNLQVRKLKDRLGEEAKIGSVDLFQGREAPVVIINLCASDAELAPRGIDFLFNPNRLNVAVSRAMCAAFIVGSPQLFFSRPTNLARLKNVALFCRLYRAAERCRV